MKKLEAHRFSNAFFSTLITVNATHSSAVSRPRDKIPSSIQCNTEKVEVLAFFKPFYRHESSGVSFDLFRFGKPETAVLLLKTFTISV